MCLYSFLLSSGELKNPKYMTKRLKTDNKLQLIIPFNETTFSETPFNFSTTQRGKPMLLYFGFRLRRERMKSNGKSYWRCINKHCNGRVVISNNKVTKYNIHNHNLAKDS